MKVRVKPPAWAGRIQHYPTRDANGTVRRWWRAPWPVVEDVDAEEVEALRRARYLTVDVLAAPEPPAKAPSEPVETVKLRSVYRRAPDGIGPAALRKLAAELSIPVIDGSVPADDVDRLLAAAEN